jgi:hypothetical protein
MIRIRVRTFLSGRQGHVPVDGVDPAHPSASRARSRRGHAAGRPVDAYDLTRPE